MARVGDDGPEMQHIPPEALLASCSEPMREVAVALRQIVRRSMPEALEGVRPGWSVIGYDAVAGRRKAYFAWIWPQPEHVHLGFVYGVAMDDPSGALQGDAKLARWLTFLPGDPLDEPLLTALLHEGARVALLSRAERFWRSVDRGVE